MIHFFIVESFFLETKKFNSEKLFYNFSITLISNEYLVDQIITANERDDTIYSCFEFLVEPWCY